MHNVLPSIKITIVSIAIVCALCLIIGSAQGYQHLDYIFAFFHHWFQFYSIHNSIHFPEQLTYTDKVVNTCSFAGIYFVMLAAFEHYKEKTRQRRSFRQN